jgi:hypothetical protein
MNRATRRQDDETHVNDLIPSDDVLLSLAVVDSVDQRIVLCIPSEILNCLQ